MEKNYLKMSYFCKTAVFICTKVSELDLESGGEINSSSKFSVSD